MNQSERALCVQIGYPYSILLHARRFQMTPPAKKTRKARSKLGRGLSALVDQSVSKPVQIKAEDAAKQRANIYIHVDDQLIARAGGLGVGQVVEIDVLGIKPNPHQPRRVFSEESLGELARSIDEHGLMQPIVVRRVGDGYELIAGERRWRASCQAGCTHIKAMVLEVDDAQSAQLALIENIQREDLNPIERGNGFAMLASGFSMTQEQIATKVGISRSSVANILRVIELDDEIQSMIASGQLSAGHGKALLSCADLEKRSLLAKQAVKEGWNVRELEKITSSIQRQSDHPSVIITNGANGQVSRFESVLHDLENRLGEQLSTKVKLKTDQSGTRGSIIIEFYDLDHFDGLMDRFGIQSIDELGGDGG